MSEGDKRGIELRIRFVLVFPAMTICYTSHTALEFWRWQARTASTLERPKPTRTSIGTWKDASDEEIVAACRHFHDVAEPIHVLVPEKSGHRRSSTIIFHRSKTECPSRSIFRLANHLFVASPEYAFIQACSEIDRLHAVKLATSLCSSFVLYEEDARGFVKCNPIMSSDSLGLFVRRAHGLRGLGTGRIAAKYAVDNAASPREAAAALLLSMPMNLGGYGLHKPLLNKRIELSDKQQHYYNRPYITADMLWEKERVAVEYDSDAFHTLRSEIANDSRRRKTFEGLGINVITLTNDELKSAQDMHKIAMKIAKLCGKRLRSTVCDFGVRNRALRKILLT